MREVAFKYNMTEYTLCILILQEGSVHKHLQVSIAVSSARTVGGTLHQMFMRANGTPRMKMV